MTPYRTAPAIPEEPVFTPKQIFELGKKAVAHINKGCPNGIVVEPRDILVIDCDIRKFTYSTGPHVAKHSIRTLIEFPRHWREPCCKEPIADFLQAECLTGWYHWRWRYYKYRNLRIQMFQGVVTKEDFENLLTELRGLDELVQNGPHYLRRRRARLHVRARRAFHRFLRRGSQNRSRQSRLGLPRGDGPVPRVRD